MKNWPLSTVQCWLMNDAGFAGYYEEWWHFSYGDQYWAGTTGAVAAMYGLAKD